MSWMRVQALLLATSLVACSSTEEPEEQRSTGPVDAELAKLPATTEAPMLEPAPPAVIEIDVGETAPNGDTVPISPVAPTPLTVSWTARGSVDEALAFVPFTSGVLARSPSGGRELDKGGEQLVARPELEIPKGELIGYWPDSAWHIEVESMPDAEGDEPRFYYQMSTYRRGKWVIERRRGAERWRDGVIQFRKGWHGGLLLRNGTNITRIGGRGGKPRAGARKGKQLVDMFETRAGRLYTISARDGGLYVQANCGDLNCVEANAKLLPRGEGWRFSMQTPRRSNDASMLATLTLGETDGHYLLSYEGHEWLLEPLPHMPAGMWPDAQGGLWLIMSGKLWHRDRGADWHDVGLPGAGRDISAAMLPDHAELWLAVSSKDGAKLFSTPGTPE